MFTKYQIQSIKRDCVEKMRQEIAQRGLVSDYTKMVSHKVFSQYLLPRELKRCFNAARRA